MSVANQNLVQDPLNLFTSRIVFFQTTSDQNYESGS